MNSVEYIEEYLIPFWCLCRLLWKHCDLKLIYKKTQTQIQNESINVFPYNAGYIKRKLPHIWTNEQQQVLDTYAYALFKRV